MVALNLYNGIRNIDRLVLDGDIDPELAIYLRAVGFKVRFAPRGSKLIGDDVKVLRLARKQGRILVCHDQHSDKETRGVRINDALRAFVGLCVVG